MFRKTFEEINLDNLYFNIDQLKKITNKKIIAVLKANAYGAIDYYIANKIVKHGIDVFAVSNLEEALRLRKHNIENEILIMGMVDDLDIVKKYNLSIIIPSIDYVNKYKNELNNVRVHIKVNTGLNRLGIFPNETKDVLKTLLDNNVKVEGIMTHYACDEDEEYSYKQYNLFKKTVEELNYSFKYIHSTATDCSLYLKDEISNYCRIGLGLYGYANIKNEKNLKPVISLYSEVISSKKINKGDGISYGHKYISDGEGYYNTIAIGYADGLPKKFEGLKVKVGNEDAIVVGEICMDLMVAKTLNKHELGEHVEIIGLNNSVEDRRDQTGICCCNILTNISDRVTRVYKENNKIIEEINERQ